MNNDLPCDVDEIRTLFLFEKLSEEQLGRLCREGHVEEVEPGWVLREGEPATSFYVLLGRFGRVVPPGRNRRRRDQPDR